MSQSSGGGIVILAALGLVAPAFGQDRDSKAPALKVVVLIKAGTKGLEPGARIKSIQPVKETVAKKNLHAVKERGTGKEVKRLDGTYVVKKAKVTLADGKVVDCELLVSIEVRGEVLRDVRYVSTLVAKGDKVAGEWLGYTAVFDQRE